jgi:signal transduction histidine kinase
MLPQQNETNLIYPTVGEEIMASERSELGAILGSSVLYVCQFNRSTLEITACSPGLAGALGDFIPDDFVGRYLINLFSPDSYSQIEELIASRSHGIQCHLADQEGNPVSVAAALDPGSEGSTDELAILVCVPTPDHSAMLARLTEEANTAATRLERLSDLTGLVIHDLKGALQVILGSVELIQLRGGAPSPFAQKDLLRIERATESMSLMLSEVSKFIRYDIDDYPPELTDLNGLVDAVISNFDEVPERPVSIRRTADLPKLVCEPLLIREVFHNLVENAVIYSCGERAEVTIGAIEEGDNLAFFVRDNGVGIRESDLEVVFEPLKRADHRKLNTPGTGMGLSQVKKIVERHGGRIWLESKVDVGTTVWFGLGENPR